MAGMETPMKRIVLKYGLMSGACVGLMMALMIARIGGGEPTDFAGSELVGYATMVLAFILVFFGIRAYRDQVEGGTIGFGRAFKVGILMTLISCSVYVVSWQIIYYGFYPDFFEHYTAFTIEQMRAAGESEAAIVAHQQEMASFAELYKNPLVNIGVTFLEIFPVGLVMTVVSAAILRKPARGGGAVALAA
jgi:hypothetical protein